MTSNTPKLTEEMLSQLSEKHHEFIPQIIGINPENGASLKAQQFANVIGKSKKYGLQIIRELESLELVKQDKKTGLREWVLTGVLRGADRGAEIGVLRGAGENLKSEDNKINNLENEKKIGVLLENSSTPVKKTLKRKPKTLRIREAQNEKARLILLRYLSSNLIFSDKFFSAFETSDMYADLEGAIKDTGKVFSTFVNNSLVDLTGLGVQLNGADFSNVVLRTIVNFGFLKEEIKGYRWCSTEEVIEIVKRLSSDNYEEAHEDKNEDHADDSRPDQIDLENDLDARVLEVRKELEYKMRKLKDFFRGLIGTTEDFNQEYYKKG